MIFVLLAISSSTESVNLEWRTGWLSTKLMTKKIRQNVERSIINLYYITSGQSTGSECLSLRLFGLFYRLWSKLLDKHSLPNHIWCDYKIIPAHFSHAFTFIQLSCFYQWFRYLHHCFYATHILRCNALSTPHIHSTSEREYSIYVLDLFKEFSTNAMTYCYFL